MRYPYRFHPIIDPDLQLAVILPHYNYIEYIRDVLDSMTTQLYSPMSLYVIDDASTDGSFELIKAWACEGQPFHIILHRHKENLFIGAALNTGHALAEADGHRYFSWITSDNLWYPECYSILMEQMRTGQYDLVYSAFDYFVEEENETATRMTASLAKVDVPGDLKDRVERLWRANDPPYHPGLFREGGSAGACFVYNDRVREAVGDYHEGVDHTQDWDYWVRVELAGMRIGYVDKPLGAVRCHPNRRSYLHGGEIGKMRQEALGRIDKLGAYQKSEGAVSRILPEDLE